MNVLIESLGGITSAKKYLEWMESEGILMGSYRYHNGYDSFYVHTLRKAIEKYETESKS